MKNFWKNKKVLVTGGGGFIGSHTVELLVEKGAKVTIPVRKKTKEKLHFLENVLDQIKIVKTDLFDPKETLRVIRGSEIVLNLAAKVAGIAYNLAYPGSIFRGNMQIFFSVIEAARLSGVERFLVVSSACVYPLHVKIPTPEEEGFVGMPEPTNIGYGWAKRMEEFLGKAYSQEYGMKIAIARPYNAYGPRDDFDSKTSHVIPGLIKRVIDGQNPLLVWGSGKASRSFLYVKDFARGLLEITEKYPVADVLNLGADEEITIGDLAKLIIKVSGRKIKLVFDRSKPDSQSRRHCDISKAKRKISFKAKTSLEEGLRETIEWYKREKGIS